MTVSVREVARELGISPRSIWIVLAILVLIGVGAIYAEYDRRADLAARGDFTYYLEQGHIIRSWQDNGGGREVCVPDAFGGCGWQPLTND